MVLFCGVVAVFTTIIWPNHSYWVQWAQALGIGLVCWAVIEFGPTWSMNAIATAAAPTAATAGPRAGAALR